MTKRHYVTQRMDGEAGPGTAPGEAWEAPTGIFDVVEELSWTFCGHKRRIEEVVRTFDAKDYDGDAARAEAKASHYAHTMNVLNGAGEIAA